MSLTEIGEEFNKKSIHVPSRGLGLFDTVYLFSCGGCDNPVRLRRILFIGWMSCHLCGYVSVGMVYFTVR